MKLNNLYSILLVTFVAIFSLASCKPDDDHEVKKSTGSLKITFDNQTGMHDNLEDLVISNTSGTEVPSSEAWTYTSAMDTFTVKQIRYFVGNFVFVMENGQEHEVDSYYLIEKMDGVENESFVIEDIPVANYVSVKFKVGVKPEDNASLASEGKGDLQTGIGMNWNWDTGYIFYKQEGQYYENGEWKNYGYHIGKDSAYAENYIESIIPGGAMVIAGETTSIHYFVNVNAFFGLEGHAAHGSTVFDMKNKPMIHGFNADLAGNWAAHMFEIDHVHAPHSH